MNLQCQGTTKSGNQCKMSGTFQNGYCHLHQPQHTGTGMDATAQPAQIHPSEESSVQPDSEQETTFQSEPQCAQKKSRGIQSILFWLYISIIIFGLIVYFYRKKKE